jgi:hypothetical protein
MASRSEHAEAARAQRELPEPGPGEPPALRDWIRVGSLAASSHNTQPWRVRIDPEPQAILIQPDDDRRCPVVDPHDAHLFKSLGCMAENIRIAASVNGYATEVGVHGDVPELRLTFRAAEIEGEHERYRAIAERQCTRTDYDGSSLDAADREALLAAASGDGVRTLLIEDEKALDTVVDFVERGNAAQLGDAGFRRELAQWIRFNPGISLARRDGLASVVMDQRSLPQWLGETLSGVLLRADAQSERDAAGIRSSAAVAVIVADDDALDGWVESGRVYQRLALTATARGLKHAFINQPIEVASIRPEFRRWLDVAPAQPMLMIRIGRAEAAPYSLRRPLEAFLAEPATG